MHLHLAVTECTVVQNLERIAAKAVRSRLAHMAHVASRGLRLMEQHVPAVILPKQVSVAGVRKPDMAKGIGLAIIVLFAMVVARILSQEHVTKAKNGRTTICAVNAMSDLTVLSLWGFSRITSSM